MEKDKIRSISQSSYAGFANNAWLVNDEWCCDHCNRMVVIPAPLNALKRADKRA